MSSIPSAGAVLTDPAVLADPAVLHSPAVEASSEPHADFGPPTPRVRRNIKLVQLHEQLWRVTRNNGEVLGYVETILEPRGRRFRSKRLLVLQKRFVLLGDFWSFDDALDCLQFG